MNAMTRFSVLVYLIQIIHNSSRRASFKHTGLTCYTLRSPSVTFSLFHSELKTYPVRKSYPPSIPT